MLTKVTGLIIREIDNGDNDKYLILLTVERGRLFVCAKGVKSMKSSLRSSVHIMLYGEFTLYEKNKSMTVREISPINDFYDISMGIEKLALISYICDVLDDVATEENGQIQLLRLALNCMYAICNNLKQNNFIKAVFEMRICCESGFMPDLTLCQCGTEGCYFDIPGGILFCGECIPEKSKTEENKYIRYCDNNIIKAMRFIAEADINRIFLFSLTDDLLDEFFDICEMYLLSQLDRDFKTLKYYHSIS